MLLEKAKKPLQDVGYNRKNRIQEKLNQYGDTLLVLENDLAILDEQIKNLDRIENDSNMGFINKINSIFFSSKVAAEKEERTEKRLEIGRRKREIDTRIKTINSEVEKQKKKMVNVEKNLEMIEKAKNFQELNVKSIKSIRHLIKEENIVLTNQDRNMYTFYSNRDRAYLVYGLNELSDNILEQIYVDEEFEIEPAKKIKVTKNIEEFNVNSIDGIEDSKYFMLIPVDTISKENILGVTTENKLQVRKFDKLNGSIIICPESTLEDIQYKGIEKVGIKGENVSEYVDCVLKLLGETAELNSIDIREFSGYQEMDFKEANRDKDDIYNDVYNVLMEFKKRKCLQVKDITKKLEGTTKYKSISDIFYKAIGKNAEDLEDFMKFFKEKLGIDVSEETKLLVKFVKGKVNNIEKLEKKLVDRSAEFNLFKRGEITRNDLLCYSIIKDVIIQQKDMKKRNIRLNTKNDFGRFNGENCRNRIIGSEEYIENANRIFDEIKMICEKNEEFKLDKNLYGAVEELYMYTVRNWKKVYDSFNYEIELDDEKYKVRPEITKAKVLASYDDEDDSIYNAGKITYTINKIAHSYKKQAEVLIKKNFLVEDEEKVEEILNKIIKTYNLREIENDERYKQNIESLGNVGDTLIETNRVEYVVKLIAQRRKLQKSAFECKNELIDYMAYRLTNERNCKKKNYVYGYRTDVSGTALILDIPNYEQLRVHVVSDSQISNLQENLPEYPLNILTENRGNILVRGLNEELEKKLKGIGNKEKMQEYIKTHTDKNQSHEIFLLLGYQGRELINAMSDKNIGER